MKRYFGHLLLLSVLYAAPAVENDRIVPILPTVFYLSRASHPYDLTETERPTIANTKEIIRAARKLLVLDDSEHFENVIILDEGGCWFVSFHARGNGNVRFRDGLQGSENSSIFLVDTNAGIYLNKKSLTRAKRGPPNPVQSLPLVSPMGERVKGIGFVVQPGEALPDFSGRK